MKQPPTVLLVDDDLLVRATLAMELRWAGFKTLEAGDAPQALQQCSQLRPDIALVDLRLPGQCGIELMRRLQHETDLPCVMLTGMDDPETAAQAQAAGAAACLHKPIDTIALRRVMETVLESSRSSR